jgi:endonuclease I
MFCISEKFVYICDYSVKNTDTMRRLLRKLLLAASLPMALMASAAAPVGYYSSINGKTGAELRQALYKVICNQTLPESYSTYYNALPDKFRLTDVVPGTTQWWDMYSADVNSSESFDNMNREHALPKSWWGGTTGYPAYVDLNHLYPSESSINQSKSNWPLGRVLVKTTDNGVSKVGAPCFGLGGSAASVFEPSDTYKGDFARTYFYMALRYFDAEWDSKYPYMIDTESDATFQPWAVKMLLEWSAQDPVSEKEINRNDAVYSIQNNRNPFIDHPELIKYIWGDRQDEVYYVEGVEEANTDYITTDFFGITRTNSYLNVSAESDKATYTANIARAADTYAVQMRATNSSCIIAHAKSNDRPLKAITVKWNDNTSSSRKLLVYTSTSPITSYEDIPSTATLTVPRNSGETTYAISGNPTYVALVAQGGAIYLDNIRLQWGDAAGTNRPDDDDEEEAPEQIATFNFSEPESLNPSIARSSISSDGYSVNTTVFTDGPISVSFKKVAGTNCRLYPVSDTQTDCRVYTNSQIIVTAKESDIDISAIKLTKSKTLAMTATNGSIDDSGLWTPDQTDEVKDNVVFTATGTTSISAIEVEYLDASKSSSLSVSRDDLPAHVEYYNLQGVRVNGTDLASGIYIRRQGTKVTKVLIK